MLQESTAASDTPSTPSMSPALSVVKRDNTTTQPYSSEKIWNAVSKAWLDTLGISILDPADTLLIAKVVEGVDNLVRNTLLTSPTIGIEEIQNFVELVLISQQHSAVAKHYILYRNERARLRNMRLRPDSGAIASYIHPTKYGRYLPDELRREQYLESCSRVEEMHHNFFNDPQVSGLIKDVFKRFVETKRLLPSMRSLQFGGQAQLAHHARGFNCCSTYIDRVRVFQEIFYLLLCGCGVGYSVQKHHVSKLPPLLKFNPEKCPVRHFEVPDSIEGWADAAGVLMESVLEGVYVEFSYHKVRGQGAPLKTSGGKAPGHRALRTALEAVRTILYGALGRRLSPLECHDIVCLLADAVLSGGIRRSALIALFSLDDNEMMACKTGDWHKTHVWRQNANNSVVVLRDRTEEEEFKKIFQTTREWGEPGFYFTDSLEYCTNPCCEVSMYPFSEKHQRSGFSFCNLVEINASLLKSREDFLEVAQAAATLGTLQAAYTQFPYLGEATEDIARRDALLGVGMTGMMDSVEISTNPQFQAEAAQMVLDTNAMVAQLIGINPAARATCIKPSGTTSLALGCVGSGHHAHHSRRYIRRVTANELEPTFQYFKAHNPHMCVRKSNGDWVIEFPVEAPPGAIIKADLTALRFLEMVKSTQEHWVRNGTRYQPPGYPGDKPLHHNVSNTVQVAPHEWAEVADYIWDNREFLTGVSLIASTGDKDYQFAPNEAIKTLADEGHWNNLIQNYKPVDWGRMLEMEDGTSFTQEAACPAGGCET